MNCITVLYPAGPDIRFDADYYRDRHLVTIMELYGKSIKRFELRKVLAAPDGSAPAFNAAVNIWIGDQKAFEENGQKHGETLVKDVPNFTNAMPTIQNDVVYGEAGQDLNAMTVGGRCLTILYPYGNPDTFNHDYYRDSHLPMIMKLCGTKAISRFELRKGLSSQDGTGAPPYTATINIYIGDQEAFDEAGKLHNQTMIDDVPNFSQVHPVIIPTEVYGASGN